MLALNALEVEQLSPLDPDRLAALHGWAERFDVIELDEGFAGFVVTVAPGTAYDSENYRWFAERYDDFVYLDRVVVAPGARRRGVAGGVYDVLESEAAARGRLVLEVNVEPPNEASLAFHRARGFVEVGRRGEPGHRVSLQAKELP